MRRAIFLDREGVINEDIGLVYRMADVHVLPGTRESLQSLKEKGYLLVVITNQPVVARGLISEEGVKEIHEMINKIAGGFIDKFYFCPHHPEMHPDVPERAKKYRITCLCRKPAPGMLLQAAQEFNIDLANSWMIGDMVTDVAAGKAAGCKTILIRSESNKRIISFAGSATISTKPDFYAESLPDAVQIIIQN